MDFEKALLLLEVIVECGKHGPAFQSIAAAAQLELKPLVDEASNIVEAERARIQKAWAEEEARKPKPETFSTGPGPSMTSRPRTKEEVEADARHNAMTQPPMPAAEPQAEPAPNAEPGVEGDIERRI